MKKGWIILAILIVALASTTFFFGAQQLGSSTLSVSEASLQSSSKFFSGKAWLITVVQGGLGQSFFGTITPNEIQAKAGEKPTQELRININYDKQKCMYPISTDSDATRIYKIGKKEWACATGKFQPESYFVEELKKQGEYSPFGVYGIYPFSFTCFATYISEESHVGFFGKTDVEVSGKITTTISGKQSSFNFDSKGATKGYVGDDVYAIWQGNLDTGKSCEYTTQNPFRPVYQSGKWITVSGANYQKYASNYDDVIETYIIRQDVALSQSTLQDMINQFNSLSDQALQQKSFGVIDAETNLTDAVVTTTMKDPLQYPVITMYVKADTLGIYTPIGEPKIESAQSTCFKTGDQATIQVNVKNIGDEFGSFTVYAECKTPFVATRNVNIGLKPNEQDTVYIPISATATTRTESRCTVYAVGTEKTVTKDVGVCVDPLKTCTPNAQFCDIEGGIHKIKKCDSEGVTTQTVKECLSNEICANEKCVPKEGKVDTTEKDDECKWYDMSCGTTQSTRVLVAVLGGLIILTFGLMTLPDKFKKKERWIGFVMAMLISAVAGLLLYQIFYIGLIISIIAGIVFIVLKTI